MEKWKKYTFKRWSDGNTSATRTLTVDDHHSSYTLTAEYEAFEASMSGPTPLNANQNGTFTVHVSGGSTPYSYIWYRMEGFGLRDSKVKPGGTRRPPVGRWIYHSSGSASAVSNGVSPGFKMKCVDVSPIA